MPMDDFCGRALPYIKAHVSGESGPAVTPGPDDSPVLRDLGNGLLVVYVVDRGQSFEYVQNWHLSKAGITAEDLHAAAMNNLLVFMGERTRMQPHGNIFAMFLDGNFEASLLLVDQLWDQFLVGYAQNGFVVAVPARDVLAFADAGSAAGIAELRGLISRLFPNGDHLISRDLYRRVPGRWEKYEG
jgi:uncharacterized protein YtpQ (UPF0354 family)